MLDKVIKWLLIALLVFTPIALGSVEIWAFLLMELGILLIIVLWAIQMTFFKDSRLRSPSPIVPHPSSLVPRPSLSVPVFLLSLFLALVLLQMIPLPAGVLKVLSPKAYELRTHLMTNDSMKKYHLPIAHSLSPISLSPFATKVEFFKWITLPGFFITLLRWQV